MKMEKSTQEEAVREQR